MVGRDAGTEDRPSARPTPGAAALTVEGLRAEPAVRDVSFEVRRGEILGLAGLMGSGRTETLRAIFGADRAASRRGSRWARGSAPSRIRLAARGGAARGSAW